MGELGIGGLYRELFDRVLDEFLSEFRTAKAINSGSCGEFAHCVNEAYRRSGLSYHVVFTTFDFLWNEPSDGLCEMIERWDSRKMSMFGVSVEEFERYKRDVSRRDNRGYVGYHVFLYDGERYYDAECPEGVTSVLDLPFYRSFR